MRIVHYTKGLHVEAGGVVRAVLNLCGCLAAAGHEVTLLTPDPRDAPPEWLEGKPGAPRIVALPALAGRFRRLSPAALREAEQHIRAADVVHLHAVWHTSNMQMGRLARRLHVPYVMSVHGMLDDWSMSGGNLKKRVFLALGARANLERAAIVHFSAEAEREQSMRRIPRATPYVAPLVVDLEPFVELPGPERARQAFPGPWWNGPVVLFLGRLHPVKGVDLLLRATRRLLDDGVDFSLILAGTGEPRDEQPLRALASELKLNDRAVFLGHVGGVEKTSLYQAADVFALPSLHENFGFVLPEAMASGTPCLTTPGVAIWRELEASGGAIVVQRDEASIAAGLRSMLADPARRATMGEKARGWVFENLAVSRVVAAFEDLYRRAREGLPGSRTRTE